MRLRLGNREQLVALMQNNEVDISVMGRAPREWPNRAEPFAMHPHVLITAPNHPFAQSEGVPAVALAREAFIVREPGYGTRAAIEEYLASHGTQPVFIMEMPSNEAIKQAVMAGLGVSMVSLHTICLEWRGGLIAAPHVEGLPLMRRWHLVNAVAKMLSPAAEAFRHFIFERGEAHLAAMFGSRTARS